MDIRRIGSFFCIVSVLVVAFCDSRAFSQDKPVATCTSIDVTSADSVARCMLRYRDEHSAWTWIEYSRPSSCKEFMNDFARMISVSDMKSQFYNNISGTPAVNAFPSCEVLAQSWKIISQKPLYWSECTDNGTIGTEKHIAKCLSGARKSISSISSGMTCQEVNNKYKDLTVSAGAYKHDPDNFFSETAIYRRIMGGGWKPVATDTGFDEQIQNVNALIKQIGQEMRQPGADRRILREQLRDLQSQRDQLGANTRNQRGDPHQYAKNLPRLFGAAPPPNIDCNVAGAALAAVFGRAPEWTMCSQGDISNLTSLAEKCIPKNAMRSIRTCDEARQQLKSFVMAALGAKTPEAVQFATCQDVEPILGLAENVRRQEAAEAARRRVEAETHRLAEERRKAEEAARPNPGCEPFHNELVALDSEVQDAYTRAFGASKVNEALSPVIALQMLAVCPLMGAKYPMFFYDLCIDKLSTDGDGKNRPGWIGSSPVPQGTKKRMQDVFGRAMAGGCFAR